MLPQPQSYLRLSQLLESEISSHNRTLAELQSEISQIKAELQSEIERRIDAENSCWKQGRDISEWGVACETAYASLNQHRLESEHLHQENQALRSQLEALS
jgi:predicted  nucleic acid-binding Zn-ribbon protein